MSKLALTPWDIVRARPFEAGGFIDSNPNTSSDQPIQQFIDENGVPKNARIMRDSASQKAALREYMPSLYTGGMRKLMQVSHLRGESHFYASGHDSFLPDWADTYGVWISSSIEGFCNRYIIRICSSGIYRIPIRFSRPLPENWQAVESAAMALPAQGAAQTLGRMWSAGDFDPALAVQIADAPSMYTDGNGGIYSTCGWAFDSAGHHAVNVGVRIDPDDPFAARKQASLYRIDITEGTGADAGKPVSASCTRIEYGELVNHFNDKDPNQGPAIIQVASALRTAEGLHGYCITYPCFPGTIGPRLFSANNPVFAYYDPNDALHVVRFTPFWDSSTINTSTSYTDARNAHADEFDILSGDLSASATFFGPLDDGWPYPTPAYDPGVMSITWGSASRLTGRTMRFTSPAVSPTAQSYFETRSDSSLKTHGDSFHAVGGDYATVFVLIEWDVTTINLTTGESTTSENIRIPSVDSFAETRVSVVGVISETESRTVEQRNHQVLVLHGYDRTSYAVYTREATLESDITTTFGGTELAVPDTGSLEYNGRHSLSTWVSMSDMSVFDDDRTDGDNRTISTTVGISKFPSMITYRISGANSVTPPGGFSSPGSVNVDYNNSKVIVGSTAYSLAVTIDAMEDVYQESEFFFKAGGSFQPGRAFYQIQENLSAANVVGVGSYGTASGQLTCFVGWF